MSSTKVQNHWKIWIASRNKRLLIPIGETHARDSTSVEYTKNITAGTYARHCHFWVDIYVFSQVQLASLSIVPVKSN